jgi:hypothetical protein
LFAHTLISSCAEETDRIYDSSSMCSLVHCAKRSVEKRFIFHSATVCSLSIIKHCSYLRPLIIGGNGFMLIWQRNQSNIHIHNIIVVHLHFNYILPTTFLFTKYNEIF